MRGTPLTALKPQMADSPSSNLGTDTKKNLENRLARCNFQFQIVSADVCRVRPLWPSATNRHYNTSSWRTFAGCGPCGRPQPTDILKHHCTLQTYPDTTIITYIGCGWLQGPRPATNRQRRTIHSLPACWVQSLFMASKHCSHGIQALFLRHPSLILTASKHCSHGIQALFSRHPSLVLTGAKPCSCEVEAMFVRGCNNVLNIVIL